MDDKDLMRNAGKDISLTNKALANEMLIGIGISDSKTRYECIDRVSEHLSKNEPFLAIKVAEEYLGVVAAYRLLTVMMTRVKEEYVEAGNMDSDKDEEVIPVLRTKALAPNVNRGNQLEWYYDVHTDGKSAWIDCRGQEDGKVQLKDVHEIWATLDGDIGYKCVYRRKGDNK